MTENQSQPDAPEQTGETGHSGSTPDVVAAPVAEPENETAEVVDARGNPDNDIVSTNTSR